MYKNNFIQKGQTLIEVMVAMTVGVLVLTAITSSVLTSLVNSRVSKSSSEASQLAQQGIEIARASRTAFAGKYCLDSLETSIAGTPEGTCTTANITTGGISYIRSIDVQGDNPNNDCGTGVNKIISTVRWTDSKCPNGSFCHQTSISSCLNVIAQAINEPPPAPAPGAPIAVLDPPTPYTSITTGSGHSTTLNWRSTNATKCTATGGSTGWAGEKSASGSLSVSPTSVGTYTYYIYCTSSLGVNSGTVSRTVTVNNPPTVNLTANPTSVYTGSSSNLTWTSTNATTCNSTGGSPSWPAGSRPTSQSAPGVSSGALSSNTTFTLTCTTGDGVQAQDTASVTVTPPPPTASISPTSASIALNGSVTLSWTVTNITSCTKELDWTGTVTVNGSSGMGPLPTSRDYRLRCTGLDGSTIYSNTVHVSVDYRTDNFTPIEDAYTSEPNPTSNYGGSDYLQTDSSGGTGTPRHWSYMKFNLSSLASTRTVLSAHLYITACDTTNSVCDPTTVQHRARGVSSNSWTETGVAWSGQPTMGSTFDSFGGSSGNPVAKGTVIDLDALSWFSDKLGTTTSVGFTTDNGTIGGIGFFSRSYVTTTKRPRLTIVSEL